MRIEDLKLTDKVRVISSKTKEEPADEETFKLIKGEWLSIVEIELEGTTKNKVCARLHNETRVVHDNIYIGNKNGFYGDVFIDWEVKPAEKELINAKYEGI